MVTEDRLDRVALAVKLTVPCVLGVVAVGVGLVLAPVTLPLSWVLTRRARRR